MTIDKNVKHVAGGVLAALAVLAGASSAQAAGVKVGVLNCHVAGGWGFVIGSSKNLYCAYASGQGDVERYKGTISKFGVDIGYTRGGVIVWNVIAPTLHPKVGALQGSYAGATASASVGIGGGAHVLVGGFQRSIALQPVSIAGDSGLNVAAGIGAINLKHLS